MVKPLVLCLYWHGHGWSELDKMSFGPRTGVSSWLRLRHTERRLRYYKYQYAMRLSGRVRRLYTVERAPGRRADSHRARGEGTV